MDATPADRPDERGPLPGVEPGHDCWDQVVADLERAVAPIRRDARRFNLPPADIDDIVQDALCQAWLKRDEHDRARPLIPWLRGFGRRAILARLMARSVTEESHGTGPTNVANQREALPDNRAEDRESRDRMRALVAQAPPRYREVLLARHWEGLRISAVADRLGQTSKAVERCLSRALAWLEAGGHGVAPTKGSGAAPRETQESEGEKRPPFG